MAEANNTIISRQSFENQIRLAEDFKRYLHGIQETLSLVAQSYQQKINALYEASLMDETYQKFEQEYAQQTIQLIVQVVEHINECDIPFVERYIAKFEHAFPFRDVYGNIVTRSRGNNRIIDIYGEWLYEIRGDRIYDTSGNWIYEFRGNDRIYDRSSNWVYEIRGDRIYDTSGNWLGYKY